MKQKRDKKSKGIGLIWLFSSLLLCMSFGLIYMLKDAAPMELLADIPQPEQGRNIALVQVTQTPQAELELAQSPEDTPLPPALTAPTLTPAPSPTPSPTPSLHPHNGDVLTEGMSAPIAVDVQIQLMVLEYMDFDQPEELFGAGAAQALSSFQKRNGLPVTGSCDKATFDKLYDPKAKAFALEKGDIGDEVEIAQEALYQLGYLEEPLQGTYDEKTAAAVKRFRSKNGLAPGDGLDYEAYSLLLSEEAVYNAYGKGDKSPQIALYQQRLLELGYLCYKADGDYGSLTQQAVRRFQNECNLLADGTLNKETVDRLMDGSAPAFVFTLDVGGSDVQALQQRLHDLGYLNSKYCTGSFNKETEAAVKQFQSRNGLKADGRIAADTLQRLLSDKAKAAPSTPKPTKKPTPKPTKTPAKATPKPTPKATNKTTAEPKTTSKPKETPKPTPKPTKLPEGGDTIDYGEGIEALIAIAQSKLGCKYVRGAKGPDRFDCSGFVYWCLNQAGVKQGYMTSIRWRSCEKYKRITDMNSLKRGDILVFVGKSSATGHVGIYLGNGKMIDAGSSAGKVLIRDSIYTSYWKSHFLMAYRVWE